LYGALAAVRMTHCGSNHGSPTRKRPEPIALVGTNGKEIPSMRALRLSSLRQQSRRLRSVVHFRSYKPVRHGKACREHRFMEPRRGVYAGSRPCGLRGVASRKRIRLALGAEASTALLKERQREREGLTVAAHGTRPVHRRGDARPASASEILHSPTTRRLEPRRPALCASLPVGPRACKAAVKAGLRSYQEPTPVSPLTIIPLVVLNARASGQQH
jgi:hypothetical protein